MPDKPTLYVCHGDTGGPKFPEDSRREDFERREKSVRERP